MRSGLLHACLCFHLISALNRAFGEVREFLKKLGHRPFLKRYLKRNEILSSITACDTSLNEALGMFSVSAVFHLQSWSILTRTSALTAFYPDPYSEAYPSQRAAKTEGNA